MIDVYNQKIIPVDIVLYNGLKCEKVQTRKRPKYYIIEKDLSIVADKLSTLGLDIDALKFDELLEAESYIIISQVNLLRFFKDFMKIFNFKIENKNLVFEKGTFIVPMNQRRSNLAVETLEPEMLSGFLRFNVIQPDDISKIHRYVLNKEL